MSSPAPGDGELVRPAVVVLMGVAGAGKTTVGQALAEQTRWAFIDADDYHSAENRAKMAAGRPLSDADRLAWLETVNAVLVAATRDGTPVIVACSALTKRYRAILGRGLGALTLIYLHVTPELARARTQTRRHFFHPSLVGEQFARLEVPNDAVIVDAARPVAEVVGEIAAKVPNVPGVP